MAHWPEDEQDLDENDDPQEADMDPEDDEEAADTRPCPRCREQVYEDSVRCPYCGEYMTEEQPSRNRPTWFIIAAVLALLALGAWLFWTLGA